MDHPELLLSTGSMAALASPVGVGLSLLGTVCILLILFKALTIIGAGLWRTSSANEFLRRYIEEDEEAFGFLAASSAPLSRLLLVGAELDEARAPVNRIEADLRDALTAYLLKLSRFNGTLKLAAFMAPVLGVFGTLLGLMDALNHYAAQSAGEAEPMAEFLRAISNTLWPTALGLAIALPAWVVARLIEMRIYVFRQRADAIIQRFLAYTIARRSIL